MFYIAESDGKVHGTHPKLKKHTQIILIYFFKCEAPRFSGPNRRFSVVIG